MAIKPLLKVVSEYVTEEIERNNLTQREFAKISGISQGTLVKIIRCNDKDGINSRSIDLLLRNKEIKFSDLLTKYGEYE